MAAEMPTADDAIQTFRTPKEPVRGANQTACLVHIYPTGPNMGTRYALGDEPVFIGRQDDCAIQNTDGSVSRYHAKVFLAEEGGYVIADLGSTNGTFVNNQRRQEGQLRDGDYVRIGNCIYRYLAGGNIEAEYHEEIYRLTVIDGLTQVHNRRYLAEFLDREVARSQRHGRPLSVVLFDIDRFKSINDRFGHLAGDVTLRELCGRVKAVVRPDELLARYGGEEFAVVLPEADHATARVVAERIREVTEKTPFSFNDVQYPVTVSLGVACTSSGAQFEVSELLARADANLYKAKLSGRNRVVVG
jgi:diguanylate cyclase (GGDEF)-like protein